MECTEFVKSLADPFHCRNCRRTLEQHRPAAAPPCDFITVVLDRSGSMQSVKAKTIDGFNTYLDDQRAAGQALMTLVQFDDVYEVLYDAAPIETVEHRSAANYQPRGSTALLDALGRGIAATAEKVAQLVSPPRSVMVSVITDGLENASVEFGGVAGRKRIFEMIEEYRREGWQFFFLGAEQAAIEAAVQSYGFARSHTASYDATAPDAAFARLSGTHIRARQGDTTGFDEPDPKPKRPRATPSKPKHT